MKLINFKLPYRYMFFDSSLNWLEKFNEDSSLCIRPSYSKKVMVYYAYANGNNYPNPFIIRYRLEL